jgi:hypothetical protein
VIDDEQRRGAILPGGLRRGGAACERRDQRAGENLFGADARGRMVGRDRDQRRADKTRLEPVGAARRETATGGRRAQVRREALDGFELDAARQVEARDRAHQADRIRVRGFEEHVIGRALLDDARRVHHVHAVGVARNDPEIVRDHDHRDAEPARQLLHQLEDLCLDGDIEGRGRLVRDDEFRIAREPDRDHHALAHAA